MIFSTGDIIVEMISNIVIPNSEQIYPTIDTHNTVMIVGNNTANDCDTFGGTESGKLIFNFPESTNFT